MILAEQNNTAAHIIINVSCNPKKITPINIPIIEVEANIIAAISEGIFF